jgi:hypothetical protein
MLRILIDDIKELRYVPLLFLAGAIILVVAVALLAIPLFILVGILGLSPDVAVAITVGVTASVLYIQSLIERSKNK